MAALLIALGYYLGAQLGFALTLAPVPVSILWPPNAILLAGLLLTSRSRWPHTLAAVAVAHVAVQFQSGVPLAMVLCWYVSNCTEALIGAMLLRRSVPGWTGFDSVREVTIFLLYGGLAAPFLSSFVDAGFVALNGWGSADYWTVWRVRFLSNVLAMLTLVPAIVTTATVAKRLSDVPRLKLLEAAAVGAALLGICWAVFVQQRPGPGISAALVYTPLPLLVAAAVRLGPWGASVAILTCALTATWGASIGQGPFVTYTSVENARSIQLFLCLVWVPVMSLAAVIRERAAADAQARFSEAQLAAAIEAARLGRWDWDVRSGRLSWSDITREIYEVAADVPVTPETFERLVHPDDRPLVAAAASDAMAGRPVDVEFRILFPDGRVKWILSKGQSVGAAGGRPERIVGVKVDVTARKHAELQLHEQQRRLAQRSGALAAGELSTALANELNQPLAAILANAAAARRFLHHDPVDLRRLRDILDDIAQDNQRAAAVLPRVGALVRSEVAFAPVDVNDLVARVLVLSRGELLSRGVSAVSQCDPDAPGVLGDAAQLQELLLQLVINGCEAMEDAPADSRSLVVTTAGGQGEVTVTVRNTGNAIAPDLLAQIFEPFVTTKPRRLGLGLAICRSIAAAHHGRLIAGDHPGGGAMLSLTLPAAPVSRAVARPADSLAT